MAGAARQSSGRDPSSSRSPDDVMSDCLVTTCRLATDRLLWLAITVGLQRIVNSHKKQQPWVAQLGRTASQHEYEVDGKRTRWQKRNVLDERFAAVACSRTNCEWVT